MVRIPPIPFSNKLEEDVQDAADPGADRFCLGDLLPGAQ